MQVVVSTELRFEQTPDGRVWTNSSLPYTFWQRYLSVFDHVHVLARVEQVATVSAEATIASGDGVSFLPVPYYHGLRQYLRRFRQVQQQIRAYYRVDVAYILRLPSPVVAATMIRHLIAKQYPFGIEAIGDPYSGFAPGTTQHPLRPLFRWWFTRQMRYHCQQASASAYVTRSVIQENFPPAAHTYTTYCSDVELEDHAFRAAPPEIMPDQPRRLISIGSMEHMGKGFDTLLEALAICRERGVDFHLTIVGEGQHRHSLQELARNLCLSERVDFSGQLPAGQPIRDALDAADLFILPTRSEGLPRVIIEAMARGLPCLSTNVGGIPELLPPEDLLPSGDPVALADKIEAVIQQPERLRTMAAQNLSQARDYHDHVLNERRQAFYTAVANITQRKHP